MSRLLVNTIRAYSGSTITIPSTTRLSLGGSEIDENSVLPSASGQTNEAVGSNGTSVVYDTYGATSIQVFQSSSTYTKSSGVNTVMVRLVAVDLDTVNLEVLEVTLKESMMFLAYPVSL